MTTVRLTAWRKASRSGSTSDCVEIGYAPGLVGIRDTKNRDGGTLLVDHSAFTTFLGAVKTSRIG
ncbi:MULTISPECIES: DUF397 domain-containing protein [Actinoalloteichus]|uniref:DUF397 family protein n=1 Tax=Actinoalloteichus fjordicus TaxID=1612552 RepID=A0AAC9PQY4_9PSEU|nr:MULTISPECIES: DUF397 domain-containing protein [Actinoalloteichus]APU13266.1 putative DUF397 family protein [Actinoalloteichus fjordicus]APU19217.1 putative DUF397 family protein [Actinoalloteichus sp. GBA129-24]